LPCPARTSTRRKSSKLDLDKALAEFAQLQQQIADQKIPLAKQLGALEDEIQSKRREAERAQRLRDNRELDLKSLDAEVKARKDEYSYLSSLLGEYVRSFETRIHISEVQRYKSLVDEQNWSVKTSTSNRPTSSPAKWRWSKLPWPDSRRPSAA
jgi:biopolymer transport protein ExbB